jgi:hypothetical protein
MTLRQTVQHFGAMRYPGRRTLRVSWISDLARWLMSVTLPFSATLKRTAVSSSPE